MPTVAEQLRQGREARNLSVHEIAEATKLKTDQIRALEEGNYDYFTAAMYLRGSVRTYANLLKMDTTALLAQLETELASTKKFAAEAPVPQRKRTGVDSFMLVLSRLNWGVAAAIIGVGVIALAGSASYQVWKNRKMADPLKKLSSGMYQPAEPAGETLPLPTNILRNGQ
jgi:cytoskeleton protein RodZ